MVRACHIPADKFCLACFTGDYPVHFDPKVDKLILERRRDQLSPLISDTETRQKRLL
jgi:amidophosphoribosyltransferase